MMLVIIQAVEPLTGVRVRASTSEESDVHFNALVRAAPCRPTFGMDA